MFFVLEWLLAPRCRRLGASFESCAVRVGAFSPGEILQKRQLIARLEHGFFEDPDLPQSREVYDVAVKFFERHLGPKEPFKAEIDRFGQADLESPPQPCGVLFVGSSSIVRWETLQEDMAPLPAINRGFGGSQIDDVNHWFDRVVTPYQPRTIVFYAGENDLDVGKSADRVVADFDAFMARKSAVLGPTPVYFISLKPSKLRLAQLGEQAKVNKAIRALADQRADLHYIDVATSMLQAVRPEELYIADGLHMNLQGYALWTGAVKAALLPHSEAEAQQCRGQ